MRKKRIIVVAVLLIVLASVLAAIPSASANSAQRYWFGTTEKGAVIVGDQIPVRVKSEKIVFDIQQFPRNDYGEEAEEAMKTYDASVSATYEFENPADYDVTARLAFPYGISFGYIDYVDGIPSRYDVTVNGESVEKVTRYTYTGATSWYNNYKNEDAVSALLDEKKTLNGIGENTKVVKYTYRVGDAEYGDYYAYAEIANADGIYLFAYGNSYYETKTERGFGKNVSNGGKFEYWVIFNDEEPQVRLYAKNKSKSEDEIQCTFEKTDRKEYTLAEYAESVYPFGDENASAHVDWFNAIVDFLDDGYDMYFYENPFAYLEKFTSDRIMHWYEYTIEVPAGSTVTNTVTAPLYPDIDEGWVPTVYDYGYLLSPARYWADFGTLDIEVNTPFKMVSSSLEGFEKTETGYKAHFDSLPKEDFSFKLSESENPERRKDGYAELVFMIVALCITSVLWLAEIITVITFASLEGKRKNATATEKERKVNTLRAAGHGIVGAFAAAFILGFGIVCEIAGVGGFVNAIVLAVFCWLASAAMTVITVLLCRVPAEKEENLPEEADPKPDEGHGEDDGRSDDGKSDDGAEG